MKKLVFILFALALVTACDNEPLDSAFNDPSGGNNNSNPEDLTLDKYELDIIINTSFFGIPLEILTKTDYSPIDNPLQSEIEITATSLGQTETRTETQTAEVNSEGQLVSSTSVNTLGQITNTTTITYTNGNISNITYNFVEDNEDDYEYNFSYNQNTITRTEVGTSITTVFTLENNRFIKKESFDNGNLILSETVTYNNEGNCINSTTTGDSNNVATYSYDNFENPISNQIYNLGNELSILNDDYEDRIGDALAHYFASKNWISTSLNQEVFNFNITYDNFNRITSRSAEITIEEQGVALSTGFDEVFTY